MWGGIETAFNVDLHGALVILMWSLFSLRFSYCGDKWRCHRCRAREERPTQLVICEILSPRIKWSLVTNGCRREKKRSVSTDCRPEVSATEADLLVTSLANPPIRIIVITTGYIWGVARDKPACL